MTTFILLIVSWTFLQLYLNQRQLRHVHQHRHAVPTPFEEKLSLEEHQKAAEYTLTNGKFNRYVLIIEVVMLLLWTYAGGLQWLSEKTALFENNSLLNGVTLTAALLLVSGLAHLPFSLWKTFNIENKFGFNNSNLRTFIVDRIKGLILFGVLGLPILALLFSLLERSGDLWWVYGWAAWTAFGLLLGWAYPTFISPFFNTFKPLEDHDLIEKINHLLNQNGFNTSGIYVMDGSKRSKHGNAYFTGFGESKRIVFFDTLLESLSHQQIIAVLAHELGHFKHKHILKSLVVNAVLTLIGFFLINLFINSTLPAQLGVSSDQPITLLILFVLISPVISFYLQPLFSWWSRKNEFEADAFAKQKSSASDLVDALIQMYRDNASSLTPDPLYSRFYYSHPPAHERIKALQSA